MIVIVHKKCPDGFAAAWVAWTKYKGRATYYGVTPNANWASFPRVSKKDAVMMFDVTPTMENYHRLAEGSKSLEIHDHHITAQRLFKGVQGVHIDLEYSGCVLA